MKPFSKPALKNCELLKRWSQRGLQIQDWSRAEHYLQFSGYYRLSAYALPFQVTQDEAQVNGLDKPFKTGTSFEDIWECYCFDRELRLIFMDAIERIEVAVRSVIINVMSLQHGPHWYMDPKHFSVDQKFKHQELLKKIEKELKIVGGDPKGHHEVFVNHYLTHYNDPYLPPSWMIAEVLTLGTWSLIFEHLKIGEERKEIAKPFLIDEYVLRNWLNALTYLRNICAHHARLWNRQFVIKPMIAKKHAKFLKENNRCYAIATVIEELMKAINPESRWAERLNKLLKNYPKIPLKALGFPEAWYQEPFWNLHKD